MSRATYRGNHSFFRFEQWRQKHFTPFGYSASLLIGICSILGLNMYRNQIYMLLALLLALLAVSVIRSRFFRPRLDAERTLPKYATVGEKLAYRVEFINRDPKKWDGLSCRENTGDPRPGYEEFMSEKEPREDKRNAWDRKVMYHRWAWLVHRNRQGETREIPLPVLPPNGRITVRTEVLPLKRGYLDLTGITVTSPGPFGLYRGVKEISIHQRVLVLPRRYPLPSLRLPGTRRYHSGGVALSSSVGNADEFVSLRDYRPGDPQKHIHWKSWAKTDRLIIKEYQDEYFVRHALILDTFIDNGNRESFEEAVSTAASFVFTVRSQESLLDLMFVEDQAYCFSSGRSLGYSGNMLEILACVKGNRKEEGSITALSALVMKHTPLLSGCICIFLSWDRERKQLVSNLLARGVPLKVLVFAEALPPPDAGETSEPDPMKHLPEDFHLFKPGEAEEGLARL